MKLYKWMTMLFMGFALAFTACDDDDFDLDSLVEPSEFSKPVISVIDGTPDFEITSVFNMDDDDRYMGFGFCYNTTGNPNIYDATISCTPNNNVLKATITDVEEGVTYYFRAYATVYPEGVLYSDPIEIVFGAE